MDATQVLDFEDLDEEFQGTEKAAIAFLKVLAVGGFPETLFPVYEGENVVGRHDNCDITIPMQAVSKKHACIDVHGKNHLICDYNSRNKTRRNQMFLKPQAFYELVNEVELMFGDVKCQYLFAQTEDEVDKDMSETGSETASESMMPQSAEDEEREEDVKERPTSSPDNVKLEESMEKYLDQPTQDYSYMYKSPDENSPVLCAETDDETDDESDNKVETTTGIIGSSFSAEQTLPYSPGRSGNEPNLDATMPYASSPDTIMIPETPFPRDIELSSTLKRAVDVKDDSSRRVSAGNTLAYGLSTLDSFNSTRESIDASEGETTKEELSGEGCTSATEVKSKLYFETNAGQESPNNNEKRLTDAVSRQDEVLDDLLATQLYEPLDVPESPEFLQQDNEPPEESAKIADFKSSEGTNPEVAIPESKSSEGEIPEDKSSEGEIPEGKTSENEMYKGETSRDEMLEETQTYGLESLPVDERDDMATQAYGVIDCALAALDTGDDELAATQAYDFQLPELSSVFKVPGAMNTQDLNEVELDEGKEGTASNDKVESLKNIEYFDELDVQPTQNYVDNQDSDDELSSKIAPKEVAETSESSDCNLPSFLSIMGLKSDSDSDFVCGGQSSKKKIESTTASTVRKSASVVYEGEKTISSEKRCYVECPTVQDETSQNKVKEETSSSARKKSVRRRKSSTTRRGKVQDATMEDTAGLPTISAKDDRLNEEATSSTRNEDILLPEDIDEQREIIVVKRGKGRSKRGRKSAATTRSSRTREKKEETVTEETEANTEQDTTGAPQRLKGTRKRKISDDSNSKNEIETDIGKDDTESIKTEEGKMSEDDENNEMFKLQISALDSSETDNFVPSKKLGREVKRSGLRGKKGLKVELENNNGSEAANVLDEKEPMEESVSTKTARKGRSKKSQNVHEFDKNENITEHAVKEDETIDSNNDVRSLRGQKDSVIKSTKRGMADKKSQKVHEFDKNENMTDDVVKQDEIIDSNKDERRPRRQKGKSTKRGMADQVSDVLADLQKMTEDVKSVDNDEQNEVTSGKQSNVKEVVCNTKSLGETTSTSPGAEQENRSVERMEEDFTECEGEKIKGENIQRKTGQETNKNKMDEQANSVNETELKEEHKTTGRGRGRKRKSSENVNEKVVKGIAKKSRKNTTTEEKTEANDIFKLDAEEPKLPRSLSKRASSTASTASTSTTSSSVSRSRSARKAKQPEKVEIKVEKPTPRKSASGRKKSTPATPVTAKGASSRSGKKTKQESVLNEDAGASNVKIIFTGLQDDALAKAEKIVQALGGCVVKNLENCTHLVTDKVRRTVKLLCAVARGIPVVDMRWLDASKKSKCFLDSEGFILKDEEAQKKYNFSMERSLELAQSGGLLEGYRIHVTRHVRPPPEDMQEIIKSAKGQFVTKMPSRDNEVIVVSCDADKDSCQKAHIERVYTSEVLLTGILRQELDLEQSFRDIFKGEKTNSYKL